MTSAMQFDALKELVNIGVGRAASSLNDLLDSPIELDVPEIKMISHEDLVNVTGYTKGEFSCVQLGFKGEFSGIAALIFPPASAIKLVSALTNEMPDNPGIDGVMAGTLNEVGNIVINCVIGTFANILEKPFDFSLPNYLHGHLHDLVRVDRLAFIYILLVKTHFCIRDKEIEGNIFIFFETSSFDSLLKALDNLL